MADTRTGIKWFENQKQTDSTKVLEALIADDKLDWANWLIIYLMKYKQCKAIEAAKMQQKIKNSFS